MAKKRIAEVASITRGVTYKKHQASKDNGSDLIALLRANNITNGCFNSNDLLYIPSGLVSGDQLICEGDIVITMSSGSKTHVGKVAFADYDMNCTYGAFCAKIKAFDIDARFLYYSLLSPHFRNHIEYLCKGVNINNIKKSYIMDYCIDIPDIERQKQIVSKIEESLSQLDSAVETLKKTKLQLEVYRHAVLKEAFDRIDGISQNMLIKDVCNEIKVGIVIKPAQYYTDSQNSIKTFRSANVREFLVNDSDWVYITKEGHEQNKRSEIHTNDVLIVRSGYPGTACVVPEKFNGCNAIDILIAVPKTSIIDPEYLCAYTNSPYGKRLVREKKRGVAQAHLNVGGYSKMSISVPDLSVQRNVVKEIKSRIAQADYILDAINQSLQQAEALRQSILKQAFEED